ncbi:MAG: LCP family protein, partial [Acidimicrobiales bacterium]
GPGGPGGPRPGGPGGPGGPRPGGPAGVRPTTRRSRPRWRLIVPLALLVPVLVLSGFLWATWKFSQVKRVEVGNVLSAAGGGGTNYLIVGSDSREGTGLDGPGGQRSDTIMVLRIEGGGSRMMSIPRDLFVTNAATGNRGRINGAYNDGPTTLIQTVQQALGIPIHRYMEVDFVTFAGLVDAVGGVTIDFPHPAYDDMSGLAIDQAGPVELNGEQALAYVRSRNYTEIIDGRRVTDPTADIGRVLRQQLFLRTVMGKIGDSRNPLSLMRVAGSVASGIRIDDKMSFMDAVRFGWKMRSIEPESVVLPTYGFRAGGAAVLGLVEDEAPAALDQFR